MDTNSSAGLETPDDDSGTDVEPRDRRALTEKMSVLPDVSRARDADELVLVVTESGSEYLVDLRLGACECADFRHRMPDGGCKHARRARYALGREHPPEGLADVDPHLGEHADERGGA